MREQGSFPDLNDFMLHMTLALSQPVDRVEYLTAASEDDQPISFRVYYGAVVTSSHWNAVTGGLLPSPLHRICADHIQLSSFPPSLGDNTSEQVKRIALLAQRSACASPGLVVYVPLLYDWSCWGTWFGPWLQRLASELTEVTNLHSCIIPGCPGMPIFCRTEIHMLMHK